MLAKAILQEYGILKGKGRVAAAAAMEHGTLLTEDLFKTGVQHLPLRKTLNILSRFFRSAIILFWAKAL